MENPKLKIGSIGHADLALLSGLQPVGWPDVTPNADFYIKNNFCSPIKVSIGQQIVGIGSSVIHHDVAWLAHIIVHPDHRGKGIGKLITQTLIDQVRGKNIETIYLIATDLGEPVYRKVGFETETEYLFFKDITAHSTWRPNENILPYTEHYQSQVMALDQQVSGEDRFFHLEQYITKSYVYLDKGRVEGFYIPSWGEGQITASTTSAGLALMKFRFASKTIAAFPNENSSALKFMQEYHYEAFKTAKRMRLGKERKCQLAQIYNRIGGNLG